MLFIGDIISSIFYALKLFKVISWDWLLIALPIFIGLVVDIAIIIYCLVIRKKSD